jgi:integrase/recombinase XerD
MENYLDVFLNEYNSAKTRRAYKDIIENMLAYINKDIDKIAKIDLVQYKSTLQNLSVATQAQRIMCIKSYFKFLFENEILDSNPASTLSAPHVEHKPKDYLTTDEAISMMDYGNARERAIIAVFLNTGIRVAELINIKLNDYLDNPHELILLTKGNKYRKVYLNDDTVSLIDWYLNFRKNGCDNLFVSNQGTPLLENSLNATWKKLARKAGIDKHVTNHSFRSTFVTTIAKEHGILMAQMAVNHANISTTRVYIRGMEDDVKNVIMDLKVC